MNGFRSILRRLVFVCLLISLLGINGWVTVDSATAQTGYENYTYKLTQSTGSYQIWTTNPADKVFKDSAVPTATGSEVKVYAGRNEFEPFLISVKPTASGSVVVNMGNFGSGITVELTQVNYVNLTSAVDYSGRSGDNPDPLWPISNGASISVTAGQNTTFWFTVYVPAGTPAGDYTANAQIGGVNIPVRLHVFNLTIPSDVHVETIYNLSYRTILDKYGVSGTGVEYNTYMQAINQFMMDHRISPRNPTWPSALAGNGGNPYINYNCTTGAFTDLSGVDSFLTPADKYINGSGLRMGSGFPAAQMIYLTGTTDQRPSPFCGITRQASDWGGNATSAYNTRWWQYLAHLQTFLTSNGYIDNAIFFFDIEPGDATAYNNLSWYAKNINAAAPNLRILIGKQAIPELYNNATNPGAKFHIWDSFYGDNYFDPAVALSRLASNGEESWLYFLGTTAYPRFSPYRIERTGVDTKITGWYLWKFRLGGLEHSYFNSWGTANPWTTPYNGGSGNTYNGDISLIYPPAKDNSNIAYGANGHKLVSSIRLELLRDSLEDYEYFYLLNGGSKPQANTANAADALINQLIHNEGIAINRDSEMMYNLRRVIGLYLGGEIASIPTLEPKSRHPRSDGAPGNYYINFQNPAGDPTGTIAYDGNTYMKIGNSLYTTANGYGWLPSADVYPAHSADFKNYYDEWYDVSPIAIRPLIRSSVLDQYGRTDEFEFDLPNGTYNVTVGVGYRQSRTHKIVIEGITVINKENNPANDYLMRTVQVTVRDKRLTVLMGDYNVMGFLNFLDIEAVIPVNTPTPTMTSTLVPTSTPTHTPTNTAVPTNTPTHTPTNTAMPTNTPTYTATNTLVPTSTPTHTPTNTAVPTSTPTHTPTNTLVPTSTPTPTMTNTLVPTSTPTHTPTNTAVPTNTPTRTATNTAVPTNTPTRTATNTVVPTSTPTHTPTNTLVPTSTPTHTPTNTLVPTNTPTHTPTNTAVPTNTPTSTATNTLVPTSTPTHTATNTAVPTNTPTHTATNTAVPTSTPTYTPTNTAVPTNTPTHTPTNTAVPTNTPTSTATNTLVPTNISTHTPTNTAVPTSTATNTAVPTNTPTSTATNTLVPTNTSTHTPTNTAVPTSTATNTAVPTNTPTSTATNTLVPTNTPTHTPTNTAVPTNTPPSTATNTLVPTNTSTHTPTNTAVPTNTPTHTPTNTAVPTSTPTRTATNTAVPTNTPTHTPTNTAVPTNTPTSTATNTLVPTSTPTRTATNTAVPTNTPTHTPTNTAVPTSTPTHTPTLTATLVPALPGMVDLISPVGWQSAPQMTFIWTADPYASEYHIWVASLDGTHIYDIVVSAEDAGCSSGTGYCVYKPPVYFLSGKYMWKVMPANQLGDGPWSLWLYIDINNAPEYRHYIPVIAR